MTTVCLNLGWFPRLINKGDHEVVCHSGVVHRPLSQLLKRF